MEKQFWCVWCQEHGRPTVKHDSHETAIREAQRLSGLYPGSRFYVMSAVGYAETVKPTRYVVIPPAEIPF